jgi:D-alanyl-D-alanine carboxypeptidase (penicillin-binding protein 5/6)
MGLKRHGIRLMIFCFVLLIIGPSVSGVAVCGESSGKSGISAQAYLLMDAQSGKVLAQSEMDTPLPIASTTKIMTALLTLEQENLDEYFVVDSEAIKVEGSSMGLMEGDQVSLRTLAYGMLLSSGNDAANAAAVRISGSVEAFSELMNQRAKEIGMKHTSFVTPSGLHDEEHYASAYDMALLAREALQNPDFLEICSSKKAQIRFGNPPFDRWLSNHNRLLSYYDGCIGVKTGFTKAAGRCLVSAAERDGVRLICVTLNDPNDWMDHAALFDYGFSLVREQTIAPQIDGVTVPVVGGTEQEVSVKAYTPAVIRTLGENQTVTQQILHNPFCYAPIEQGDVIGTVSFQVDGTTVTSVPLIAGETVERKITEITPPKKHWWERLWEKLFPAKE